VKFLGDAKTSALSSTFEDAQELSAGAKASATLGTFGFGGDVDHATHFMYKRKIKGYLAAVVNITSTAPEKAEEAKKLTPFGAGFEVDVEDESDSEMVKSVVNKEKISVENRGRDYFFKDGVGATMTENEFARRFEKTTGSDELADVVSRLDVHGVNRGGQGQAGTRRNPEQGKLSELQQWSLQTDLSGRWKPRPVYQRRRPRALGVEHGRKGHHRLLCAGRRQSRALQARRSPDLGHGDAWSPWRLSGRPG
jgi:hypothetical protein